MACWVSFHMTFGMLIFLNSNHSEIVNLYTVNILNIWNYDEILNVIVLCSDTHRRIQVVKLGGERGTKLFENNSLGCKDEAPLQHYSTIKMCKFQKRMIPKNLVWLLIFEVQNKIEKYQSKKTKYHLKTQFISHNHELLNKKLKN